MKKVEVLYGRGSVSFSIPDKNLRQIIEPRRIPGLDTAQTVIRALQNPIGSPTLYELTRDKSKILIISSDNTRPVPSSRSIPAIISQFAHDEREYEITILIATGPAPVHDAAGDPGALRGNADAKAPHRQSCGSRQRKPC